MIRNERVNTAVQVESARADMMGVSFGIDFSGSTNFVLHPPAAAPTKTSPPTAAPASADEGNPRQGRSASCTAVVSAATLDNGEGKEGDCGNGVAGGALTAMASGEEAATSAPGRNDEESDAAAGGAGSGEALQGESARVSAGAFCRTVVARVLVRDPKVGGTIKVRSEERAQT